MKRLKLKLASKYLLLVTGIRLKIARIKRLRGVAFSGVAVVLLGLVALPHAAVAGQPLSGAGSTFVYPVMTKWSYDYERKTGVKINYQPIGSGGGIQQIIAKTVDFGASDAPLTAEMMKEHGLIQMPDTSGGVAIAYNIPGVGNGLKFTPQILAEIYLGEITNWNDPRIKAVNPDMKLPDFPIIVVHRSDGSGTTFIFTSYLSDISPQWAAKVGHSISVNWPVGIGGKGNPGVAGFITKTRGSIGYVELAYVLQNKMTYGPLKNKAGFFVWPTIATSQAAASTVKKVPNDFNIMFVNAPGKNSYPIAGFTYLIIYKHQTNPEKAHELLNFVKWIYTAQGQSMAKSLDYVPLPESLIKQIDRQLKEVTIKP
ncbi:MAG: phosphate ABC transporter substrate-binding protein PstS [Deltaproteobacteria bacterium]|nr:phosphate ABC transporter substrate-binding protein PstS [Deltaproteobacteria bacterium]